MAIGTSDFTFADFFQYGGPSVVGTYHIRYIHLLIIAYMIELQSHGMFVISTINAALL
jgi:hypothetical protein